MKKIIGLKSTGQIALIFVGIVTFSILLILFIWMLTQFQIDDEGMIWLIFSTLVIFGILIGLIVYAVKQIAKPSSAIECDGEYLYLNYKDKSIKIELNSIVQVIPRRARLGSSTYTFGKIIIHTDIEEYTITNISECEKVSLNIMKVKS